MGNRAVLVFEPVSDHSPAIYLHWNGGRASVEAFLGVAKEAGITGTDEEKMDKLADLIGHFMTSVYREEFHRTDFDNGDNGTYVLDDAWNIVARRYFDGNEESDPAKTARIAARVILKSRVPA